jgi:hypothetical protein
MAGWNSICEMTRQLRGAPGEPDRGREGAVMGHRVGDAVILTGRTNLRSRARASVPTSAVLEDARHRLMLPTCSECRKAHLPPGPACPFRFADAIEWKQASGRGVIST